VKTKNLLTLLVLLSSTLLLVSCGGGTKYAEMEPEVPEVVAEPEPVPEPEPEPEVEEIDMLTLDTIYFDFDRSDIRSDQRTVLADNAKSIESESEITVLIEGHCDERGTNEYNMALGQRRADSVKRYMVNYGIEAARLSTVTYGEERPVDYGHDEEAWSKNRRVEFVVQQ